MKRLFQIILCIYFILIISPYLDFSYAASSSSSSGSRSSFSSSGSKGSSGFSTSGNSKPSVSSPPKSGSSFSTSGESKKSNSGVGGFFNSGSSEYKPTKRENTFSNSGGQTVPGKQESNTKSSFSFFGNKAADKRNNSYTSNDRLPPIRYKSKEYTQYNPTNKTIIIRETPVDYRPVYYPPNNPSNLGDQVLRIWFINELFQHSENKRDRAALAKEIKNSEDYQKWRDEAERLAIENKDLKEQLSIIDFEADKNIDDIDEEESDSGSIYLLIAIAFFGICGMMLFVLKRAYSFRRF